jgi:hypothetical protein
MIVRMKASRSVVCVRHPPVAPGGCSGSGATGLGYGMRVKEAVIAEWSLSPVVLGSWTYRQSVTALTGAQKMWSMR